MADLLTDDSFLCWQIKKESTHAQHWKQWMAREPNNTALAQQAIQLLSVLLQMKEKNLSEYQVNASFNRLLKKMSTHENRLYSIL